MHLEICAAILVKITLMTRPYSLWKPGDLNQEEGVHNNIMKLEQKKFPLHIFHMYLLRTKCI